MHCPGHQKGKTHNKKATSQLTKLQRKAAKEKQFSSHKTVTSPAGQRLKIPGSSDKIKALLKKFTPRFGLLNTLKYKQLQICRWYHSNGRKWRVINSLVMRVKEESEKAGLKLNVQKRSWYPAHHSAARRRDKSGNSDRFYFLGFQNHCSDCSHEIKRHLLPGRKAMTNLDSKLKTRDSTLPTKVCMVKATVFQ